VLLACGPVFTLLILRATGVEALSRAQVAGVAVAAAGAIFGGTDGLPALFQNMVNHVTSVQTNGH